MNTYMTELQRRLLYILHLGLVEARSLARTPNSSEQLFDLTDALENLPSYIDHWEDWKMELIRFGLERYDQKYHSSFDYLRYLDVDPPPERF